MNVNYLRALIRSAQSVISSVAPLNQDVAAATAPLISIASYTADRMEANAAADPRLVADAMFQSASRVAPCQVGAGVPTSLAGTAVRAAIMAVSLGIIAQFHGRHTALGGSADELAEDEMRRADELAREATSKSGLRAVA